MWSPEQYDRYRDERSRPFFDLMAQVDCPAARLVADLGCGPGSLTKTLASRFPDARIFGVDSSPEMIEAASAHASDRVSFELADIATWQPPAPLDVIVSNAALHWVPSHDALFARLAGLLAPQGVLAVQMPNNFGAPSHTLLRELCATPRWSPQLGHFAAREPFVLSPVFYVNTLFGLGLDVTLWETTYYQTLEGEDAVLEWMLGTTMRPLLSLLDEESQSALRRDYGERLRQTYPRADFGALFPFKRLFLVATKRP